MDFRPDNDATKESHMRDVPSPAGVPDDTAAGANRAATTSTPRWVKAFWIGAVVVVLLLIILLLTGGGGHGPARHTSQPTDTPATLQPP